MSISLIAASVIAVAVSVFTLASSMTRARKRLVKVEIIVWDESGYEVNQRVTRMIPAAFVETLLKKVSRAKDVEGGIATAFPR